MIGRPQETEAASYYFPYIRQVSAEDATAFLDSQWGSSRALFAGISEEKSLHRYAPEQ